MRSEILQNDLKVHHPVCDKSHCFLLYCFIKNVMFLFKLFYRMIMVAVVLRRFEEDSKVSTQLQFNLTLLNCRLDLSCKSLLV